MRGLGPSVTMRLCDCSSGTLAWVMPSGHLTARPEPGNRASPGPSSSTETQPEPNAQITPCCQQAGDIPQQPGCQLLHACRIGSCRWRCHGFKEGRQIARLCAASDVVPLDVLTAWAC